ncbi:tRNA pseudouridine(54/55) synthase Pus10 [Thermococcus argininiproducens]|uniref:tRNA pseudouridine synthase Pus10 n=1 Tax=Thermococcus argininiproducens TaxID=2866384 RepID=A0A9E7M8Y5_9EURY|nr:tRNA pseudouridine(54/55) synthase Pus10 [Thermococcus argininiproducens]USG99119.1 tRNA pseudouridine(54/55) synthase Pus10 [Thermococcus argininiproducens]
MIIEKAEKILEKYKLCNHCLGRAFGLLGKGDNYIRGESIRLILNMEREIRGEDPLLEPQECELCNDIFKKVKDLARLCYSKVSKLGLEFDTFLVGSRIPREILGKENEIVENFELKYAEPINRELNRELGKILEVILQKTVNKNNPDVVFIVDPYNETVELQIKPLYIYGRYRKLVRGIPQTPLKGFKESVASIICKPFSNAAKGKSIFHGAGREDVDVRMLGNGRPFVVEIKKAVKRRINLQEIAKEINKSGKVEVLDLRFINREEAEKILTSNHKKEYEALVYVEESVSEKEVEKVVKALKDTIIHQRTPKRVLGRRADIVRVRKVHEITGNLIDEKHFKLRLITDGGLYIKELISGDDGRTSPSVTEILGKKAWCEKLDVLNILDEE